MILLKKRIFNLNPKLKFTYKNQNFIGFLDLECFCKRKLVIGVLNNYCERYRSLTFSNFFINYNNFQV